MLRVASASLRASASLTSLRTFAAAALPRAAAHKAQAVAADKAPATPAASVKPATDVPVERKVYIFKPARVATQQGWKGRETWKIDWEQETRWKNPLMGWNSSADPVGQAQVEFPTREAAIKFAVEQGWTYVVKKTHVPKAVAKSYATNFEYKWPRDIRPKRQPLARTEKPSSA
ncbi:NADH dehydrogenase Fe-S protein 4 [Thecamonas trahens ATCC 50062]|uniref:NADH dehydrogenase [ubiquinone] iron-sulfur protein 4, mitochondrial n=1 Tax=Thecamonas trahens ATCC 50062 TaxID=461836 RepID=A0A0L0DT73_THETB|nr:NADH dehydrogenase Fe-S protein 4 [Thecamonas trahens ATCC 50062]KNC55549.1 NADH dehydrogenase Fe-S protein 4 [Thecamonas trahens ATCC 50062]|eukprot:XP_013761323.1 NADH dehydrogenase Fe-S protein 4 [Thecamonas trahens ATCC 50062]